MQLVRIMRCAVRLHHASAMCSTRHIAWLIAVAMSLNQPSTVDRFTLDHLGSYTQEALIEIEGSTY